MDKSHVKVAATWLDGIGTILSAIGNTPIRFLSKQFLFDIDFVGDVFQTNAAAILAELETYYSLSKIGNMIDASGNLVEITGNVMPFSNFTINQILKNSGNAIQAYGTGLTFIDTVVKQKSLIDLYCIYGSLIGTIGLSIQAIAGNFPSKSKIGESLNTIGNWVQAIGANLEVIGQTLKLSREKPTVYGTVGFYSGCEIVII